MLIIVVLFTFSYGGNWNKEGGLVTLMWLATPSSVISVLCFGVRYFDEVLLSLTKKSRKEFIMQLNVAGVGVNVCGAAEAPKGRPDG